MSSVTWPVSERVTIPFTQHREREREEGKTLTGQKLEWAIRLLDEGLRPEADLCHNDPMRAPDYRDRIVRDARICGGQPAFRGTRVTLRTVLASLAEGASIEEILADFPTLKAEDVRAAIAFAAASAGEDLPVPGIPDIQ